jgi:hypothetical protein
MFFHESVSQGLLNIPWGDFEFLQKIGGDIHSFGSIADVNDTGDEAVATISASLHLKVNIKFKISIRV